METTGLANRQEGHAQDEPLVQASFAQRWSTADMRMLRQLAKGNTPAGVMSIKLQRPIAAIRSKAHREGIRCGQSIARPITDVRPRSPRGSGADHQSPTSQARPGSARSRRPFGIRWRLLQRGALPRILGPKKAPGTGQRPGGRVANTRPGQPALFELVPKKIA